MTDKKTAAPKSSQKERNRPDFNSTAPAAQRQPDADEQVQGDTLIAELQKNSRERLRISVDQYRGHEYIGIRIWFVAADGEYRPSRAGVTLKPALIPQLIQALDLAARAVDTRGAN